MAVEDAARANPRTIPAPAGNAGATVAPRVHRLAPQTAATIEAALPHAAQRPLRVMAAGGPPSALPVALASLVTSEALGGGAPDVLLICPQEAEEELLGPNLSALGRACAAVVEATVPGQTLIMTSASYVGCARDLLLVPLTRRGLVAGRDVHVAVSPEPIPGAPQRGGRIVGGATPACTAAATAVLDALGPVTAARTLEDAEAASLTTQVPRALGAIAKRTLDVVGALVGMIVFAPVMAIVAVAIAIDSPGPVLFVQERVGRNGRLFRFRKFRTMTDGAEQRLGEVLHLNGIKGPAFQIDSDPRVTRVGRFLRQSSLDELPELWNVLRGEMSLVGPRPAPVVEVAAYKPWHLRRLGMKPGITGLAQIRARKYREFDVKAGLDLQYIDHWSPWLDVRILLETVPAVLRFTGR